MLVVSEVIFNEKVSHGFSFLLKLILKQAFKYLQFIWEVIPGNTKESRE